MCALWLVPQGEPLRAVSRQEHQRRLHDPDEPLRRPGRPPKAKKDAAGTKSCMRSTADITLGSANPRPEEVPDSEMETTPDPCALRTLCGATLNYAIGRTYA